MSKPADLSLGKASGITERRVSLGGGLAEATRIQGLRNTPHRSNERGL